MKTVFMSGILVNFIVVLFAVAYFNYLKTIEISTLSPGQKTAIVQRINSSDDIARLRNYALDAQKLRESASDVLKSQMSVIKEILIYVICLSVLNTLGFLTLLRWPKEKSTPTSSGSGQDATL